MKTQILTLVALLLAAGAAYPSAVAASPRAIPVAAAATSSDLTPVAFRRGFYAAGGVFYFNGHRGVVHARRGYRYHRGYWFPPAAFATRTVVVAPAPVARLTAAHIRWCYAHYASYRASDNSYQPYEGPRRQCRSLN